MPASPPSVCSSCHKASEDTTLQRCSRCKNRLYCGLSHRCSSVNNQCSFSLNKGRACQAADWRTHRMDCQPAGNQWYDKYRTCKDGNHHQGQLELITWSCPEAEYPKGWGNTEEEYSQDLKLKFETEFNSDLEKMYSYQPSSFRWTCCGTEAGQDYGCEHHGTGLKPCSCDFCMYVAIFLLLWVDLLFFCL